MGTPRSSTGMSCFGMVNPNTAAPATMDGRGCNAVPSVVCFAAFRAAAAASIRPCTRAQQPREVAAAPARTRTHLNAVLQCVHIYGRHALGSGLLHTTAKTVTPPAAIARACARPVPPTAASQTFDHRAPLHDPPAQSNNTNNANASHRPPRSAPHSRSHLSRCNVADSRNTRASPRNQRPQRIVEVANDLSHLSIKPIHAA